MPKFSLESIIRPNILSLKPYRCARDDYATGILLDANENSFGSVINSSAESLNRYPDPYQLDVKERFIDFRGIASVDNTFLGVGSDEIMDLLMRICCIPGKDKILVTPPTYGMYSVCAKINDVEVVKVNLDGRFQLRTDEISKTLSEVPNIKIVFLCSPGNPTGTALSHESIKAILEDVNLRGLVVVDEAYIDFVSEEREGSVAEWVEKYDNLVVMQTLSKSFGLAGIRLGIAIANPFIINMLNNTKAPYNINLMTSQVALSALQPDAIAKMRSMVSLIRAERAKLLSSIANIPSVANILGANDANFILVQIVDGNGKPSNDRAQYVYKQLAEKLGVVVRFRGHEYGCEGSLRITIGTPEQNEALLTKLREVLGESF
ncbi:11175_t:CDS:2 [Paraglomus brasilianum]|uniref:histidinol-phosphate transaminase n=1 Tax=Paraglomus brasilianum TaxID=144538 RepID=A0A9N9B594_9GLOM|nr:11175_t:CDS:2 [Paraglomus brasilianum]